MRTYKVNISNQAKRDIDELSDFLLTVKSKDGARRYLDTMKSEVLTLSVYADLYRTSPMADIRRYHPYARRMVSHNKRWVYIFHVEDDIVIVDRIRPAKIIAR